MYRAGYSPPIKLTRVIGWVLLFFLAVILPILDIPGRFWILLLVPFGWFLAYLYSHQLPLVYCICGILEAPGSRSQLQVGDQECISGPNQPS